MIQQYLCKAADQHLHQVHRQQRGAFLWLAVVGTQHRLDRLGCLCQVVVGDLAARAGRGEEEGGVERGREGQADCEDRGMSRVRIKVL